jgi:hypothetical protein
LRPATPNSHEDRTMKWFGFATATDVSPASFERPYADSGPVGSDST